MMSNYKYSDLYTFLKDHAGSKFVTTDQQFTVVAVDKYDYRKHQPYSFIKKDENPADYTIGVIARIYRGNEWVYLEFNEEWKRILEHKYVVESINPERIIKIGKTICYGWNEIITNRFLKDFIDSISEKAPEVTDVCDHEYTEKENLILAIYEKRSEVLFNTFQDSNNYIEACGILYKDIRDSVKREFAQFKIEARIIDEEMRKHSMNLLMKNKK
jgi:hypothetical protein